MPSSTECQVWVFGAGKRSLPTLVDLPIGRPNEAMIVDRHCHFLEEPIRKEIEYGYRLLPVGRPSMEIVLIVGTKTTQALALYSLVLAMKNL